MTATTSPSLRWRLVKRLVAFQTVMLTLIVVILVFAVWGTARIVDAYEDSALDVLRDALVRQPDGRLALAKTGDLARLREDAPDLWFVIKDKQGQQLAEGEVPADYTAIVAGIGLIQQMRIGEDQPGIDKPDAVLKWVESAAGRVQILTGTQGHMSWQHLFWGVSLSSATVIGPLFALMALVTLIVTPIVVRRALKGLGAAATQAERIDIAERGVRLPLSGVPAEILPLVKAVNDALVRLDNGYERHQRFLADAAHELRTPIAILTTRIASLPPGAEKSRLLEDANRLAVLTGQLLDFQRLDQQERPTATVDLAALAQRVLVDLAPLAFAAGYEIDFKADDGPILVTGDQTSLERALTNLIQNAIDHGGRRGTIGIRVDRSGRIEICDEGDGIPESETERIFEPFHRLRQDGRGAGLGLNLVREIVRLHGGHIAASNGPKGGACLEIDLPLAARQAEGKMLS
ncbi:sensor histidine kinase [Labrys sp. 22185]|uniref:sensor histidine kinase n=1 Tax=Labrys sp. 22185 TaxID=3453888 RepID=UPI003F834010